MTNVGRDDGQAVSNPLFAVLARVDAFIEKAAAAPAFASSYGVFAPRAVAKNQLGTLNPCLCGTWECICNWNIADMEALSPAH
jgi:hypothetical protein